MKHFSEIIMEWIAFLNRQKELLGGLLFCILLILCLIVWLTIAAMWS